MSDLLSLQEKLWFVAGWEGTEELRDFMNVCILCYRYIESDPQTLKLVGNV